MPAKTVSRLSRRCLEGSVAELLVVSARFVAAEHTVRHVVLLAELMDGMMTSLCVGKDTLSKWTCSMSYTATFCIVGAIAEGLP